MNWIQIKDLTSYIDSGDMIDPSETYSLAQKFYSPEGENYPLLCISIHANPGFVISKKPFIGLKISSSYKKKEGAWWDERDENSFIPLELLKDLEEMILEAKEKVS